MLVRNFIHCFKGSPCYYDLRTPSGGSVSICESKENLMLDSRATAIVMIKNIELIKAAILSNDKYNLVQIKIGESYDSVRLFVSDKHLHAIEIEDKELHLFLTYL